MGLFNKIKSIFSADAASDVEFGQIIENAWKQYTAKHDYFWNIPANELDGWTAVKNWPDKKRISFAHWLVQNVHSYMADRRSYSTADKDFQMKVVQESFLQALFRNKMIMDDDDIDNLYQTFLRHKTNDWSTITSWPVGLMLNQIFSQRKGSPITSSLQRTLHAIKAEIENTGNHRNDKERVKLAEKIDDFLFSSTNPSHVLKPVRFLGNDQFGVMANQQLETMPEQERVGWYPLLTLAQKASGAKPSGKFISEAKTLVAAIGADRFKKVIHEWLQFLADCKEEVQNHSGNMYGHDYNFNTYEYLTSVNADAVKGLVWTCAQFHDSKTIHALAELAERAFKKIPGKGPAAASVGNACLYTLFKSKGLDGIGQLSKLKLRIKQGSTQNLIDRYLEEAAKQQGVTVSEIEDMSVEDYGLIEGKRFFEFDDYKAALSIKGVGKTETIWYKPDGSPQQSVPAAIKTKHKAGLQKLKDAAKHIEQAVTGQRDRLDRMFRDDRKISWENFQQYYLQHGLMCFLAKRLIWNFHKDNNMQQGIWMNDNWVNVKGEVVQTADATSVSLWHPVQATVDGIREWRQFFIAQQLLQPLKQAFREIYLLTDAEVNTKSYSNRMASHILRQHQFNSLAKGRGWRYSLMGAYDNGMINDKASLEIPAAGLRAEYWINEVNADGEFNDTGIWNYVSTDQVRFINMSTNETIDLIDVPALVLSEVMRDVDLFVGVASVGNDPAWRDSGGITTYSDYWTSYSFGDLGEVAKNRKQILEGLIPRLKIRDVATVSDKFVIVKGKLRTYKIHIGSTNILMEPNDQYLCIVPDRSQKNITENIFLPFEGDNGLSVLLSKAFLLAEDDKITDTTITSQIHRK